MLPLGGDPSEFEFPVYLRENWDAWSCKLTKIISMICLAIFTQYRSVTNRWTELLYLHRAMRSLACGRGTRGKNIVNYNS